MLSGYRPHLDQRGGQINTQTEPHRHGATLTSSGWKYCINFLWLQILYIEYLSIFKKFPWTWINQLLNWQYISFMLRCVIMKQMLIAQYKSVRIMTPLVFRLVYYNAFEGSKSLGKWRTFLSAFTSPLWMKSMMKLIVLSCRSADNNATWKRLVALKTNPNSRKVGTLCKLKQQRLAKHLIYNLL